MFQGSDTDALQKAGQECAEGARTTDEIIMVVKLLIIALLAASWFTGGASAKYAEVLQTKVLPWLQKISAALHMFSQVLTSQADAQDKVSAGESVDFSTLPTYTSPWSSDPAVAAVVGAVTGTTTGATPTITTTPSGDTTPAGTTAGSTAGATGALIAGAAGSAGALGGTAGTVGTGAGSLLGTSGTASGAGSTFGSGTSALGGSGLTGSGGSGSGGGSFGSGAGLGAGAATGSGSSAAGDPGSFGAGASDGLGGGAALPTGSGDSASTAFRTDTATGATSPGAVTTTPTGTTSGLAGSLGAAGAAGALGLGGAAALAGRTAGQGTGLTSPDGFDYTRIKGVENNPRVTPEFLRKVEGISQRLGTKPENLMAAMSFETGGSFDPAQKNTAGGSARGLIQFMPDTARGLGTSSAELVRMTPVQQLDYVEKYFKGSAGKVGTVEGLYSKILAGHAVPDASSVLFAAGTKKYAANAGLDADGIGGITSGEAAAKVRARIMPAK